MAVPSNTINDTVNRLHSLRPHIDIAEVREEKYERFLTLFGASVFSLLLITGLGAGGVLSGQAVGWTTIGLAGAITVVNLTCVKWNKKPYLITLLTIVAVATALGILGVTGTLSGVAVGGSVLALLGGGAVIVGIVNKFFDQCGTEMTDVEYYIESEESRRARFNVAKANIIASYNALLNTNGEDLPAPIREQFNQLMQEIREHHARVGESLENRQLPPNLTGTDLTILLNNYWNPLRGYEMQLRQLARMRLNYQDYENQANELARMREAGR